MCRIQVPEKDLPRLKVGQTAWVTSQSGGEPARGEVNRISPIVDPQTGTFKITIEISDDQRRIKPGMFGRMSIVFDMHANALQIPRSAIIDSAGELSVFVVKDGIGIRRTIETDFSSDGMVEVTSGIEDGESVITVGHVGLKNESKVVVINQPAGESE